jgi:hypothetical protein
VATLGFDSPTFNFIMDDGMDLPRSTNEELARALIATGEELWGDGILENFVDHNFLDDIDNWMLKDALTALQPDRLAELGEDAAARRIFETTGVLDPNNDSMAYLYIGHGEYKPFGKGPLWFWIERTAVGEDNNGYVECRALDVVSMTDIFDRSRWPLGELIFTALVDAMKKETKQRRASLNQLDKATNGLSRRLAAVKSTSRRPMTSIGIEG